MSWFKGSIVVFASLALAACGSDGEESPTVSAVASSDDFLSAQDYLHSSSTAHTNSVMSRTVLTDVTLDEVHFHERSVDALVQMEWDLRALQTCRAADESRLDTSDAQAAVRELRAELAAHQVGMLTMVDSTAAQAAEMNFQARQTPLFDELESHASAFAAIAADYECPF